MKRKVFVMSLVMTVWAAGFYALGRHHGVTKGKIEIPTVNIKWGSQEPAKTEAAAEVVDYVAISNAVCDGTYDEYASKKDAEALQAKAKAAPKDASAK